MTPRENLLRAVRFERPDYIPMSYHINSACWNNYPREALTELVESHPFLFPTYERGTETAETTFGNTATAGKPYVDDWGCRWETVEDGIAGVITEHLLADWNAFDDYVPPDPEVAFGTGRMDWARTAESLHRARGEGRLVSGGLQHGHTFLRLSYIRGYENLLFDMADDEPRLHRLIEMVEAFNMAYVRRYLDLGVEWMSYPEDLGMQVGPMCSPDDFRKYIKPSYQRLMAPAREAGCIIHMHSDGDIKTLVNDLIDGGVEVINLQDLVNGIDWIAGELAGKYCIELDIDRQDVTVFGTPDQVDALVREEVEKVGSKEGGLMMIHGMYPGMPLENAKALMDAMEKYSTYYG
ncbi:MAG: hypothetical protein HOC74_00460 [Gemmatimonadetes bacterium]|nr:hypothetical protein [Gemmatimonadota bacterium]